MKQNVVRIIIGILVVLVGMNLIMKASNVEWDLFFDGWWTLLIIIFAVIAIINQGPSRGSIIMLLFGCYLLAARRGWIPHWIQGDFVWGGLLIVAGLLFVISSRQIKDPERSSNSSERHKSFSHEEEQRESRKNHVHNQFSHFEEHFDNSSHSESPTYTAIFGGREVRYEPRTLSGANVFTLFGGMELDLRHAQIHEDIIIDVTAIFGGVDLRFPSNVRLTTKAVPIFGGIDDKSTLPNDPLAPIVTLRCLTAFGGITILN
jgi:hypothetical protein